MKNIKSKKKNLYELLNQLDDYRRKQGRMHELRFALVLAIMSIMSGFSSLRAMGDFIKKNKKELIKIFKPKKDRLPTYLTINRVLQNVDFNKFTQIFQKWAIGYVKIEDNEWVSIDGKAIGGTADCLQDNKQKFISLVSVFLSKKKQVLQAGKIDNGKESEIPKVRELIKILDLEGAVLTMDALHCQKETVQAIIKSNNNYCIGVKGNQKKLYEQLKKTQKPANR
jgi:hypothetical protein